MRQAITTKYISPTSNQGARIKARCQAGSLTVRWKHNLDVRENHMAAAEALAHKLGWNGEWLGGFDHNEHGVFVMLAEDNAFCIEKAA